MNPQNHHKNIIFCGDSYAAHMEWKDFVNNGSLKHQWGVKPSGKHKDLHPSIVANHFKLQLKNYSFCGKSWWYSRYKLLTSLASNPDILRETFAMVFFHTDSSRINVSTDIETLWRCDGDLAWVDRHESPIKQSEMSEEYQSQKLWLKYLEDPIFQTWAQEQWFREIERSWSNIPSIHFCCFHDSIKYLHLLPGKKFSTPLVNISVSELIGTDEEIFLKMGIGESRANHFSDHNNRGLASVIISALENYSPGISEIDLSGFDLPNLNGFKYPKKGYGTK